MQLGERVKGLMMEPDWRFVTADAFDVHRRVNEYDSAARLAARNGTRQIGVVRFIDREALGEGIEDTLQAPADDRGGAWLLVIRAENADGTPMIGEPSPVVLEQMKAADIWARRRGVNPREILRDLQKVAELQEAAAEVRRQEAARAFAEPALFKLARQQGLRWANRIFVPNGAKRG